MPTGKASPDFVALHFWQTVRKLAQTEHGSHVGISTRTLCKDTATNRTVVQQNRRTGNCDESTVGSPNLQDARMRAYQTLLQREIVFRRWRPQTLPQLLVSSKNLGKFTPFTGPGIQEYWTVIFMRFVLFVAFGLLSAVLAQTCSYNDPVGPTSEDDSFIQRVSIGTIDYTAPCPGKLGLSPICRRLTLFPGLDDQTARSVTLQAGQSYTLNVVFHTCGGTISGSSFEIIPLQVRFPKSDKVHIYPIFLFTLLFPFSLCQLGKQWYLRHDRSKLRKHRLLVRLSYK